MTTSTTSKRVTKATHFNRLLTIAEVANNPDLVEFINHELELLERKNASPNGEKKMTATQKENVGIKEAILSFMEIGKRYTVGDIIKDCPECEGLSTSKVSAILRQMREDVGTGEIRRIEDKRKTYFEKVGE